jgi:hypothetical protein
VAEGNDLAVLELAIRTPVTRLGAGLLEGLLAADDGYRGPRADCGARHQAALTGYRAKTIDTWSARSGSAGPGTTAPPTLTLPV